MRASDAAILHAIQRHGSQRKAAAALGINSRTLERRLARMGDEMPGQKGLVVDIETKPLLVYTWGMFQQNIAPSQVVDWGGMLCFAAGWIGSDETIFRAEWESKERMLRTIHDLFCEADYVIGWNSKRFDERKINAEFQRAGMKRPTPYRSIDLMRQQKRDADFPSHKLESRRRLMDRAGKLETGGFPLWIGAMNGDRQSQQTMKEYNIHDKVVTEEEFHDMRSGGWLRGLPNLSIYGGHCCPGCGSEKLQAVKPYRSDVRLYPQWLCLDCGTASRETKASPGSAQLKAVA
jgi:hypothetical protein